ncbi:two-component system QseEF-associated lipoprotein QseG [Morganella morganii]
MTFKSLIAAVPLLLAGCVKTATPPDLSALASVVLPQERTTDYRIADCHAIWELNSAAATENALYWLRMMDCADLLSSDTARIMAGKITPDSWDSALRQSILLNNTGSPASDKRKVLETLNTYSTGFPVSLRPLMTLWRAQLKQAITLSDERQRYRRLQSDTDGRIDQLRAVNARLQFELQNTTRKLENLSNIERQLAGRKQPTKADTELESTLEERREALEEAAGTAEPKPADVKPAEAKPAEAKPADVKPADVKPAEPKAAETKPAQDKKE